MDNFNQSNLSNFGLKSNMQVKSNSQILTTNLAIENRQRDDPLLKTTYPVYLYRPPFGYPRNVNVVFLRNLARNPYVFSVIKSITDQAAETKWLIKPKEGVEMNEELEESQKYITEFFKNPNSDNESFAQLLRKVIPDILTLDSGVFYKVYNLKKELLQLRVIDGGAILKNPDRHGSLANREEIVYSDGYFGTEGQASSDTNSKVYKYALDQYNAYSYKEEAAYFQFAYGINYSIPIPYGRRELIYMIENPATDTVYSRTSALQSAVDITLNLIYSSKASLDLFLNANIPSGIIKLADATQEDSEAFQKAFYDQQYSGFDEYGIQRKVNGRLPVVGNPNVDFIPLNFKSSESQLLEIQQWFTKVLWSCFGVTAEEMGFTEDSNKAVAESQTKTNARKAVKPRLTMIAGYLNDQVLPELPDGDLFEFTFDEFDVGEEKLKAELYTSQIAAGIISPQMVAEKEGIDIVRLQKDKQENADMMAPKQSDTGEGLNDGLKKEAPKKEVKSTFMLDNKIVLSGTDPKDILKQAIELAERAQAEEQIVEEGVIDSLDDVMDQGEEKQLQTEERVANSNDKTQIVEDSSTKAEERTVYTSSRDLDHIHTATEGEDRSSYDDEHDHPIDWENGTLGPGGKDNHTHTIPELQKSELKAEEIVDDDKITDKKQKDLVLTTPIEKVMAEYITEAVDLLKDVSKEK